MARQVITKLIDDLDESVADETVKFGLDGVEYEIDLSATNAGKLREALGPFVSAGAKMSGRKSGRSGATSTSTSDREQNRKVRKWAKEKKKAISDRGRIPEDIVREYHADLRASLDTNGQAEKPVTAPTATATAPKKTTRATRSKKATQPEFSAA